MFGKNKVRPAGLSLDGGNLLQVHSVFSTIQGEGPWSGQPAIFIRLSGCNLRCWFCDTVWNDDGDPFLSVPEIIRQVITEYHRTKISSAVKRRVVLTGGEPARQDCELLIDSLHEVGFQIQIETAGSFWHDWLLKTTIVCSPKTRHVHPKFYLQTPGLVNWKYVLRHGDIGSDGLPNSFMQVVDPDTLPKTDPTFIMLAEKYGLPARPMKGDPVWVSPCNEYNEEKNKLNLKAVADSAMAFGYRAQVQLQLYLNLP